MSRKNFKQGSPTFWLYSHALATALAGGEAVSKKLVIVHAPPNPDLLDLSVRRGYLKKGFTYDSPYVPSVRNRRSPPQVRKVAMVLDSVLPGNKIVAMTVAPCEPDSFQDWLISNEAQSWAQRLDSRLDKLSSKCPGLLHAFFQVAASRHGFFPHCHLLVEVPVEVLPEQVADEVSRYLGMEVRVRSDAEEQALLATFFKRDSTDEAEANGLLYVLPDDPNESDEESKRLSSAIHRARYYLRHGIELHSNFDNDMADAVDFKDPLVRNAGDTPGRAAMMAAALSIIILSKFGRCFRSYGRAWGLSKGKKAPAPAAPPISETMCNQSSEAPCETSAEEQAAKEKEGTEEPEQTSADAKKEAYLRRGWRIKGAYWSREWVGAKDEVWRRWLHVLVEVLPSRSAPSFEELYEFNVWPSGEMVTIGDVWRAEMTRRNDSALAA